MRHVHDLFENRMIHALAAAAVLAMAALTGCKGGHGNYTSDHIAQAKDKMSIIKSATEWQMAHQQFLAGDLDKALKTVDRSIAINEKVTKSRVLRGRILLEKSRLEEARQEFLIAEKLDPTSVDAQYYLGIVYERVSQPEDAVARYRKAIELDPANAQYVVAAAEVMIEQRQLDEAEQLLTERRKHLEYNSAIRQTLGHIALLRSQPVQAAQLFNEALLLAPGDSAIMEDLVQAQLAAAQHSEAEATLTRLLEKDANRSRADLKVMRARCLMALNRPVEARTLLQEVTDDKQASADVRTWNDLGTVCAILKDKGGLRTAWGRVTAMAPERPEGYILKAMFFRQENDLNKALAAADQAVAKSGKDASAFVMKAMILQDMGRMSEAVQALRQGQKVDPSNRQVAALMESINRTITGHPEP